MKKCKNITFCHFFAFGGPCDVQKWVKVYKVYVSWKPCLYSLRRHQKKWFLSIWGRTRCNRSAQGLKMANCTSFKILTHILIAYFYTLYFILLLKIYLQNMTMYWYIVLDFQANHGHSNHIHVCENCYYPVHFHHYVIQFYDFVFSDFAHIVNYNSNPSVTVAEHITVKVSLSLCIKGIVQQFFTLKNLSCMVLNAISDSVSLVRCKNEALKKLYFKSIIKCFKRVKIDKWPDSPCTHFPHRLLC